MRFTRRNFVAATAGAALSPAVLRGAGKPNVLFILMDDLGYPSLGCFGNRFAPTPNLDRLAGEGVRFTNAYVTPQCTPTRATLLTGQYTARNKMWHVIPGYGYSRARVEEPPFRRNLSRDAFTVSKGMKAAGYATACIGKWHLTTNEDGSYVGLNPSASHYYGFDTVQTPAKDPREHAIGDKAVNRFTDEAIAFIERNRNRPWFCYLPHHSIHGPVAAPEPLVKKYRAKGYPETGLNNAIYLAAIEHFDTAIGRLLAALDRMGLRESTMVVFLTDNGGVYKSYGPKPETTGQSLRMPVHETVFSNAPLRAGKGFSYEGGIRVPMIVRWPGVTKPGAVCDTPVHAVDLMPTFFEAAGGRTPEGYTADGVSLVSLFGGKSLRPRPLYWYMPFYDVRWLSTPNAVVRDGDYKLIEEFGDYIPEDGVAEYRIGGRLELFDLSKDPGERTNLAERMPDRAARMSRQLREWIRSTGSVVPGLNPKYDPAHPLDETKG